MIGYVNKLKDNYGKMNQDVLLKLFKSHCSSFYGSPLWNFNSSGFDKICKSWNVAIRMLLYLPYNTHIWILEPLLGHAHIRNQLYVGKFFF